MPNVRTINLPNSMNHVLYSVRGFGRCFDEAVPESWIDKVSDTEALKWLLGLERNGRVVGKRILVDF